jgi:hypothetical protein
MPARGADLMEEGELEARLRGMLTDQPEFISILKAIMDLGLPDCWLAAGAVRNTVWRRLFGEECELGINDFDVVFFDVGTEREAEVRAREALNEQFPNLVFDVKNQAGFGNWRPWRYQFTSAIDGVAHFLHTATAIAIRVNDGGEIERNAPYGLADLFAGILRATPFWAGHEDADAKAAHLMSKCSRLRKVDGQIAECRTK